MRAATVAVLHGLLRRPAVWLVCGGGWIVYGTISGKVIPLIIHLVGDPAYRDAVLPSLLPSALPGALLGAYPLFGALFMITLAGLVVGHEYRWATMGTLLVAGRSRRTVAVAQLAALVVVAAVTAVVHAVVNAAAAYAIAVGLGAPTTAAPWTDLLAAVAGSWLVATTYVLIGALVAHLFRSAVAAVAAAVVLVIGLENVVGLLALVLPAATGVQAVLPGPSGGALALALGAPPGTPGLVGVVPPAVAVGVLLGWCGVAVWGCVALVRGRDVTGAV